MGGDPLTERAVDGTELVMPRLLVPAYFHPATHPREWAWLTERPAQIELVVLNMASGPGTQPDAAVLPTLDGLRAAGITVCGYVDTNYGDRLATEVIADTLLYLDWYRVDGVFFDRAATGIEQVSHYADLIRQARGVGARLAVLNHGAHPIEAYADHADLLGTFEGPWDAYLELGVPRWVRTRPPEQFYHLVHTVPIASFTDALWLAARRHAGSAYITDRTGVNPWDGLPAGTVADQPQLSALADSQG
jgi:hypothetical protein